MGTESRGQSRTVGLLRVVRQSGLAMDLARLSLYSSSSSTHHSGQSWSSTNYNRHTSSCSTKDSSSSRKSFFSSSMSSRMATAGPNSTCLIPTTTR